ncbi:hypothetical protein EYE40_08140 [Glaciihabitans arcticus]|uniref:Lipoprotein n=1 Tax=Glaciihabitans arcticus TaxID=2668039 RepID=A0A4V2JEY5_9MICO|nr:hypothetical protein [Glaciihabitans arcticus]TBN57369.1 hypothetical protein EYE40_08140 [Glaciihabitans arcticus]
MNRLVSLGGVLLAAAMLAGCSSPSAITSSSGRIIAVAPEPSDAAEDALAQGAVGWSEGGCLTLEGGSPNLIVFPHGTTLDGDTVVLPDGTEIQAGDDVSLGGGFHGAISAADQLPDVPRACITPEVFWASGEVQ